MLKGLCAAAIRYLLEHAEKHAPELLLALHDRKARGRCALPLKRHFIYCFAAAFNGWCTSAGRPPRHRACSAVGSGVLPAQRRQALCSAGRTL